MSVRYCPRCSELTFEKLRTHAYCMECNYCPDIDDYHPKRPIEHWVFQHVPGLKPSVYDLPYEHGCAH